MVAQSKIIYFSEETNFSHLVRFYLQSEFNFNILQFNSDVLVKEYIKDKKDFFLILCDGSIPVGKTREFFDNFRTHRMNIPFFIVGNDEYISKFRNVGAELFHRDRFIEEVEGKVKKFFIKNHLIKPADYCPISFNTLTAFDGLQCDVFIKLNSGRHLKIYKEEDQIHQEDVNKYAKKGIELLYLNKKTSHWILKQIHINFKAIVDALDKGEKIHIAPEPVNEKKKKKGEADQSFTDLLKEIKEEKEAVKEKKIQESIDGAFNLSEEFKHDIDKRISKAVKVLSKNKNIKKFLDKMKVDRNPNQYFKIHVNLLCKMTCAIAQVMEWSHASTLEKLVYVSYMHDITMVEHPHVARIANLVEFKAIEGDLRPSEIEMFHNHPALIRDMINDSEDFPIEADKIIFQHHELPNSKGFPSKLQTIRILPLSCLFIIAHDFVDYIIDNPDWVMDEYIVRCKDNFVGAGFTKIIKKLSNLELK
ncbi:hypothetical protein A9Q84_12665 [Halobacteriovorax marinus]|uniref:HD-GYP domain-containing protein n=1 Tax=Halobacteriovorax marinus TaxID=97084 RepID=A0A1Y5FF00_9BACT|nr:hypothetical protein A9Q84_12665 [Halobacteriovorax marinus]